MNIEQVQHIPSSQTTPTYEVLGKQVMITPFQFDAMQFICSQAQKQISLEYGLTANKQIAKSDELKLAKIEETIKIDSPEDLFNFLRNQVIKIDLNEVAMFTKKYKSSNKTNMLKEIYKLQDVKAVVNQVKMDDGSRDMKTTRFPLISRIEHTAKSNTIEIRLEHEMIYGWVFNVVPFSRVIIQHQTYLSTMYSKQIYSLCAEYQNLGKFSMEFDKFKNLLQLKAPNLSQLKGNYLNRAVKEINEYTEFNINKIYGQKVKGVTTIYFEFTKQEVQDQLSIEETTLINKKEAEALIRLEKAKEYQDIKNEEAWLKKTVNSITDEFIETQDLIKESKIALDEINIKDFADRLERVYLDFVGMKDYKLVYIFDESKPPITNNALETYRVLEELD